MFTSSYLKIPALYGSLALAIAACGTSPYEELQTTSSNSGEFSTALASEYKDFAKSEIDQYDWPDQHTFAVKGLSALAGKRPLPEHPDQWRLSDADLPELQARRADLISWLDTNGRHLTPVQAAKAQRAFDCWVEQKQENWQDEHIRACRDGLARNMPDIWQVQFPFDSAQLNSQARARLNRIARDWQRNPGRFLLVQGHADKHGKPDYNYRLSYQRAKAVGLHLAKLGIAKKDIRFEVWGESRPRPSAFKSHLRATDKVNRRVEVLKF